MRLILEAYRWVTLFAFWMSFLFLLAPAAAYFMPGYHVEYGPWALIGFAGVAFTFATSGLNVIGIAIYDQLRDLTTEAEYARTEIAYLREELRGRG